MGYMGYGEYRGYGLWEYRGYGLWVMGSMGSIRVMGGTTHEPKFNHLLLQSDTNLTEL